MLEITEYQYEERMHRHILNGHQLKKRRSIAVTISAVHIQQKGGNSRIIDNEETWEKEDK